MGLNIFSCLFTGRAPYVSCTFTSPRSSLKLNVKFLDIFSTKHCIGPTDCQQLLFLEESYEYFSRMTKHWAESGERGVAFGNSHF